MMAPALRASGSVAALAVAVLALAGCGLAAPGKATPDSHPAAGKPAGDVATQQRLQRALLTTTELPLGFETQDGTAETSAIGCPDIDRLYLAAGTARAAVSFGHAVTAAFVNETITVQPGAAAANVESFRRAVADCRRFAGSQNVSYQVTALPGIPRYGDATAALRITSAVREARPVDLVAVRLGDTVVIVANANSGQVDTDLTATIADRAIAKLRRVS